MPDIASSGRQPRGAVKINGTLITGWVQFEVQSKSYFSADTFRLVFAASRLPSDRDRRWFSQQKDMYVELFAGFPADPTNYSPSDLNSWIYGQVDLIEYDPVQNVLEVTGRDLSRVLIDAKTTEKWPNLTSSQIVTVLAQRHGLTPVVAATTQQVGKFYEIDHVNLHDQRTEWDILTYLAQTEGHRVWVRGQSLYYQPVPTPSTSTAYRLIWTPPAENSNVSRANMEGLKLSRALTVSRGIFVEVRSWNKKQAHGFSVWYPKKPKSTTPGGSQAFAGGQAFHKTIPNLDAQQALKRAQALYQQIIAHEMTLQADLPADNDLDTTSIIEVVGTDTDYDQFYYPESITRTMSIDSGYSMSVRAKNTSPASQADSS